MSFIFDMLYYEMMPAQRSLAMENISILSGYLYNYLQNPTAIGMSNWNNHYSPFWANTNASGSIIWTDGYDKINLVGTRSFEILASLGYSRLVLGHMPGNDQILDWVMYMLDSVPIQEDFHGLLQYIVKKSGAFVSGYGYASQALKGPPQIFFTALKRISGINYWDNQYIKKWANSVVDNLTPGYYTVSIEDDWWETNGIDRGLIEYYYQNSNDPNSRDKIKWYLYRLKSRQNGSWPYTKNIQIGINFPIVYSYNPNNPVGADDYHPLSSLSGIYSNQEYTHLSPPLSGGLSYDAQAYKNRLWLHVNHENSYEEEHFHTSQEKGHYRLYYNNMQFIIDPGYRAIYSNNMGGWWRTLHWFRSIYSKNMIVVNPDEENERLHINEQYSLSPLPSPATILKLKRPLSGSLWALYTGVNNLVDDCKREYLVTNQNIRHLKIRINYNDLIPDNNENVSYSSPVSNINSRLIRNFYTLGNEGVLVYDKVTSLNGQSSTYRNQLHFNPSAVIDFDSNSGIFSASIGAAHLYGVTGAITSSSTKRIDGQKNGNTINDTLFPHGLPTGNEDVLINSSNIFSQAHSRIRVDTGNSTGCSFITMLLPSLNGTNPITTSVETANDYLSHANIDVNNQIYLGINNNQSIINGLRFITDAELFYISANHDFSNINSLIINNGNSLVIRNYSITGFGEVSLFQCDASNIEESIAEWNNSNLFITINSNTEQYPKFKIIRNTVDPSNFFARLLYNINWNDTSVIVSDEPISRGVIPNVIQSLAYDADYFYVNYSWDCLENEGLITNGLVIVKGSIPDCVLAVSITFNGVIRIEGNLIFENSTLELADNTFVVLEENSKITLDQNSQIIIGNNVTFTNENNEPCYGIFILGENHITLTNCTFNNCDLNIEYGSLHIENSSFINSAINCNRTNVNIVDCPILGGVYCNGSEYFKIKNMTQNTYSITGMYDGVTAINCGEVYVYGYNISSNARHGVNLHESYGHNTIENCTIISNGSDGVRLYHSNARIIGCYISGNNKGIIAYRGSNIEIFKDPNTTPWFYDSCVSNNTWIEILFTDDCDLQMANGMNKILDAPYDPNTFDRFLVNCPNMTRSRDLRYNYWGSDQWDNPIYPSNDRFNPPIINPNENEIGFYLEPLWNPGPPHIITWENDELIYHSAIDLALAENIDGAIYLFKELISQYPGSDYAPAAAKNLLALEQDKQALKNYYATEPNLHWNGEIDKLADYLENYCNIKMGDYQTAIAWFEAVISNPPSELDSLMAVIDLGYVYLLMQENPPKAPITCRYPHFKPKSRAEYERNTEAILSALYSPIENSNQNGYNVPLIAQHPVLHKNYPNPFNPVTTISFILHKEMRCNLDIYNIKGQKVKTLYNGVSVAGTQKVVWDGTDDIGKPVSSGLYYYRLSTPQGVQTRKMLLLK